MNLQAIDTIQDLREWVSETMQGAQVREDSAGNIVIHTGLGAAMGGYLYETDKDGECDNCNAIYEIGSQDNRCGNCGNCENCCTHKEESK